MKDDDDTLCYRSELEAAVRAAVEAEREACAQLCEEMGDARGRTDKHIWSALQTAADSIRERKVT